jgi:hypothetical protein
MIDIICSLTLMAAAIIATTAAYMAYREARSAAIACRLECDSERRAVALASLAIRLASNAAALDSLAIRLASVDARRDSLEIELAAFAIRFDSFTKDRVSSSRASRLTSSSDSRNLPTNQASL